MDCYPSRTHSNTQAALIIDDTLLEFWAENGKETTFKLTGNSMYPSIKSGDKVVIQHTRQSIRIGSVVAFRRGREIIVHRVIKIKKDHDQEIFLTKGDFNRKSDIPITEAQIIGKVVTINKDGGRQIDLQTPYQQLCGHIISSLHSILSPIYRIFYFHILKPFNKTFA